MNIEIDEMEIKSFYFRLLACLIMFSILCRNAAGAGRVERPTTYIVHMDKSEMPSEFSTHHHWYKSLLSSVKGVSHSQKFMDEDLYLYIYDNVMQGFSAKLTQLEADALEEIPGHVLSFPDPEGILDTTHSTAFLGLSPHSGLLHQTRFGEDVIVAVLDTGIWPESRSFHDNGMKPVPARWKGTCENGTAFASSLCNKKLIGARYFNKGLVAKHGKIDSTLDYDSARDFDGHGSHTSSTAGGNYVDHVDFYGYAPGTARGVAPAGRIAMYKVVWSQGGMGSDILAGIDSAISDGADVLSMSFGFGAPPYFKDIVAIGAFQAIKRGMVVVCSAGNNGTERGITRSMHNGAPWIFTVGASTMDRDYAAVLKLGDGTVAHGASFFVDTKGNFNLSQAPLHYESGDPACRKLDRRTIRGKVVLCVNMRHSSVESIQEAEALGLVWVTMKDRYKVSPYENFPVAVLKPRDGEAVVKYAVSASNPIVDMNFNVTALGIKPAPVVADFSSRGPYPQSSNILKPDVIAPGVNILAAWRSNLTTFPEYNMISGTSMSCPHVAGLSALVKAVHRDWSPAAIRSALMTTSYTLDNSKNHFIDSGNLDRPATPLDFGAGHVDPEKAVDPGLVYDLGAEDYITFLCNLNYTVRQIKVITGTTVSCPAGVEFGSDALNYPSFTAIFEKNVTSAFSKTFKRILTNVGDGESNYKAVVEAPKGVKMQVDPTVLDFKEKFQKLNFTVTVEVEEWSNAGEDEVRFGYLSWIDKRGHVVKSPVVALFR